MKLRKKRALDFVIDKLTNSVQNTISGDSFETEISLFVRSDSRNITKKRGWQFNWQSEIKDITKEVYKLTIVNNPTIIQGLISLTIRPDHILMNLVESAPFNIGKDKIYEGVAGNLVAFACKLSFQYGFEGFVSFTAKTRLIEHYERTLGAYQFGGHRMIIPTISSRRLVEKYFKI